MVDESDEERDYREYGRIKPTSEECKDIYLEFRRNVPSENDEKDYGLGELYDIYSRGDSLSRRVRNFFSFR